MTVLHFYQIKHGKKDQMSMSSIGQLFAKITKNKWVHFNKYNLLILVVLTVKYIFFYWMKKNKYLKMLLCILGVLLSFLMFYRPNDYQERIVTFTVSCFV